MKIQRTRYQLVCRQFLQTLHAMKKFEQRENELYNEPFNEFLEILDVKLGLLKDDLTPEELNYLRSSILLVETQFPNCCFIPGKIFIQLHDGNSISEVDEESALEHYDPSVIGWFAIASGEGLIVYETVDECMQMLFRAPRFDDV